MKKLIGGIVIVGFIAINMVPFSAMAESCATFIDDFYPMTYPEYDVISSDSDDLEFTRASFMIHDCDVKIYKLKVLIKEDKPASAISSVANFKLQGLVNYMYDTEATVSADGATLIFDFGDDGQYMMAGNPQLFIVRADVDNVVAPYKIQFAITEAIAKDEMGNEVDLPVQSVGKKFLLIP